MCFVFLTDSHGFARIRTDWNGLERIYKKHEVLDCSFEILEWWWNFTFLKKHDYFLL